MTTPDTDDSQQPDEQRAPEKVAEAPAYSTPPPGGLPDADNE